MPHKYDEKMFDIKHLRKTAEKLKNWGRWGPDDEIGTLNFTPSFTPGLYHEGDGKDLGHIIEFKSELQFSVDLSNNSLIGFSYNHISNASLGDKNPGANSYMFNFFKNF